MAERKLLKPLNPNIAQRYQDRVELRPSDGIKAHVVLESNETINAEVFDLNAFGASLTFRDFNSESLSQGHKLSLHITFPDGFRASFNGVVCWTTPTVRGIRLGFEFMGQVGVDSLSAEIPVKELLFELPEYFPISGFYYKPYMFFERGHLRVIQISASRFRLSVFDSETILFRGQKLEIWILGNAKANNSVHIEILSVKKAAKGELEVDAKILNLPTQVADWIAHQLVFICEMTPIQVRQLGFEVNRISNGFRFRFVKTQEEYESVLRLRYKSYVEAGKVDSSKTYWDMSAPLDPKSRILLCYHGDRVVASVAISFPSTDNEILDTERAFVDGYPQPVPPKTQVVEISRLCTDSDYRRTDLLNRMFEYTYKVTVCGDRDFIITSTDNKLWPLYKKLGFKKTGMKYAHPYLSGLEHHVIIGRRTQPDFGSQISPFAWNYLWRDMNQFMDQRGLIKKTFSQRLRIKALSALGRLLKIQTDRMY